MTKPAIPSSGKGICPRCKRAQMVNYRDAHVSEAVTCQYCMQRFNRATGTALETLWKHGRQLQGEENP